MRYSLVMTAITGKHTGHIAKIALSVLLESDRTEKTVLGRALVCSAKMRTARIDKVHRLSCKNKHGLVIVSSRRLG